MGKTIMTERHIAYIKKNRLKESAASMSRKFGFKTNTVGQWMRNNGLSVSRARALKFRKDGSMKKNMRPRPEDPYIKKNYLKINVKQLSEILGRSEQFIKTSLARQGLKIPKAIIRKRIKDARIQPGHVPLNKGKKQIEYMSKEAIERTKKTRFKKGNIPVNAIGFKDGDIVVRVRHNRNYRPYKWYRLGMGKWIMYHVYIWEKVHGPVPEGKIVVFKDGDTMNCNIRNLKCITRAEHAANTRETDGYIARALSYSPGKFKVDKDMLQAVLQNKSLIELKRKQLQLKRAINEQRKISENP